MTIKILRFLFFLLFCVFLNAFAANTFVYSDIPFPSYLRKELEKQIPKVCSVDNCSEILPKVMDVLGYEVTWVQKENRLLIKRKTVIYQVEVIGLPDGFTDKESLLKNFLLGQKYSPSMVENARLLILYKLRNNGYPDADAKVKIEEKSTGYKIIFNISIGSVYKVKNIIVEADNEKVKNNLENVFSRLSGKPYERVVLEKLLEKIKSKYVNEGYYNFGINYEIIKNEKSKSITIKIYVNTGKKYIVSFKGNRSIDSAKLFGLLTFKKDEAFDRFEMEKTVENIKSFYRDRGYPFVEVDVKTEEEEHSVKILFLISEGIFVKIKKVSAVFKGVVEKDTEKEIKKILKSLQDRPFSNSKAEKVKKEIEYILYREGYIKGKADFKSVDSEIIFQISPGFRYLLKNVVLTEKIENILDKPYPLPYTSEVKLKIIAKITDFYISQGFLDAEVILDEEKKVNGNVVDITVKVKVKKGLKYKVGFFFVTGLDRIRLSALEPIFVIYPGDFYRRKTVIEQYSLFSDTSLFSMIDLKEIKTSDTVSPIFNLNEMPLIRGKGFVGYSTDAGAVGKISGKMNAPFGKGFSLFGSFEYRQNEGSAALLSIGKSGILARRNRAYLDFIRKVELFESFSVTRYKTKAYIVRKRGVLRQNYGVELAKDIVDYSDRPSEKFYKNTFFVDTIVDKRDSKVNPKNGYKFELNFAYTGGMLGGDTNYFLSEFKFVRLGQIFKYAVSQLVFAFRGGVGYIYPINPDGVPMQDKFYLGGAESIRGYRYGIISPIDSSGNYIGGDFYTLLSWELRYTIKKQYQFSLFYDRGNVFLSPEDFTFNDWYSSVGIGFRYITPVGPLRIDYGYKLKRVEGEGPGRFHISFGFPF